MPSKMVQSLSDLEWAYLAGILDGEGFLSVRGSRQSVRLRVKMSERSVIDWLHARLGGSVTLYPPSREGYKPQWGWETENRAAVSTILRHVAPYLVAKRDKADALLLFLEACASTRPGSPERTEAWRLAQASG